MKPILFPYNVFVQSLSDLALATAVEEMNESGRTGQTREDGIVRSVQECAVKDLGHVANRPSFAERIVLEEIGRRWARDFGSTKKPAVITRDVTKLDDQMLVWALRDLRESTLTVGPTNDRFSDRYGVTESAALREAARRFEQNYELKTLGKKS